MCNHDPLEATVPLPNAPAALTSCSAFLDYRSQARLNRSIHEQLLASPSTHPVEPGVWASVMRQEQQLASAPPLRGWGCATCLPACLPAVGIPLVGRGCKMSPRGPRLFPDMLGSWVFLRPDLHPQKASET